MESEKISFAVSDSVGSVSAVVIAPADMVALYVFAHGAGAGMGHPFMASLSDALAKSGIGTFRYNFPYMEKGGKRPDVPAVAEKTVNRAIETAMTRYPGTPTFAGGKSFGGRMTSQAMSKLPDPPISGIIFVGFPLHAAGNPGTERAAHLKSVTVPMLFLQGTRDALAEIKLIEQVNSTLKNSTLTKFDGADHSFKAGKQNLIPSLAQAIQGWVLNIVKR